MLDLMLRALSRNYHYRKARRAGESNLSRQRVMDCSIEPAMAKAQSQAYLRALFQGIKSLIAIVNSSIVHAAPPQRARRGSTSWAPVNFFRPPAIPVAGRWRASRR
jgi:hypothetical protein